jgi:RHS repeat-associated protein
MLSALRLSRYFLISILCLVLVPTHGYPQILAGPTTQTPPIPGAGHDYIKMLSETVNPANGSVDLRIQLPVPAGRKLTLPLAVTYDSSGLYHIEGEPNGVGEWFATPGAGWSFSLPYVTYNIVPQTYMVQQTPPTYATCTVDTDYVFHDTSGAVHPLRLAWVENAQSSACENDPYSPYNWVTGGDDIYQATLLSQQTAPPPSIADADGTVYSFGRNSYPWINEFSYAASSVEDRNGNVITISTSSSGVSVTDTLGRTAASISGSFSSGGTTTITIPGLGEPYTIAWGTATPNYSVHPTNRAPGDQCQNPTNVTVPKTVITSVTLPNGQEYQFSYDSTFATLSKVVYPTGGYVRYVWGYYPQSEFITYPDAYNNPTNCSYLIDKPALLNRFVSFNGSTEVLEQDFTYSAITWDPKNGNLWDKEQTTVTTKDLVRGWSQATSYSYAPILIYWQPDDFVAKTAQVPVESSVTYNDWSGNTIRTVNKNWIDQYEMQGQQIVANGTVTSDQFFVFGPGAQITDKYECGSGQTCYCGSTGVCQIGTVASPPTAYARHTRTQYASLAATPIFPSAASILDRPSSVAIYDGTGSRAAETDYLYDQTSPSGGTGTTNHDDTHYGTGYNVRGNATSKSEWVNTTGSPLVWGYTYDDTGQQVSMTDPKGNPTDYSYSDEFSACGSPSGSTNAYLTKIQDAKGFTQTFTYRFCDGQLSTATDRNNQTTSYSYNDSLARLTETVDPDQGTITNTYNDGSPTSSIVTSQTMDSSGTTSVTTQVFDGAGHVTRSQLNSDPDCSGSSDNTDTAYDGLGRAWKVSNPYCNAAPDQHSTGTTTYAYDALGRTTSIAYPEGSAATTAYSGNTSTVIDPAGMTRTLTYDALGRLISVVENPGGLGYSTSYSYNALDDLLTVSQGSQTRTFVYDSLSRLTSATNPESGTTTYTYSTPSSICSGDASAVCTRTDARGISTTYTYNDSLNRLTSKTYSDGTSTASFFYDESSVTLGSWGSGALANTKGRLTHTTTVNSSGTVLTGTVQDYDPMGRTSYYWQCTPYNCGTSSIWSSNYQYKYTGEVWQWTYPAGYTLTNTVSPARRTTQIQSSQVDTNHPQYLAQSINYMPWGAVSKLVNGYASSGANAQETYTYNSRLQPWMIQLGTTSNPTADYCLVYNYYSSWTAPSSCPSSSQLPPTGTTDNGNVMGYWYDDNVNSTLSHTATYAYDHVNRLTSGVATGNSTYNLTFSYTQDLSNGQYGNMSCVTNGNTSGLCTNLSFNAGTNRISTSGYSYDAAGHLTADGTHTYQWDAEGHLASVDNGSTESYTYNALRQQVRLNAPGNYTWDHLYDTSGSWMGRWSGSAWSVSGVFHLGGRPFAIYIDQAYFVHVNALGSTAMTTNSSGSLAGDKLFYPWGQDWAGTSPEWHYAGFEQGDGAVAGLFPTLLREYAAGQGRWLTPDPAGKGAVKLDDPQTWNMYAYVRNNPTTLTDPTGLDFNLVCMTESESCHNRQVGTWTTGENGNRNFTPTVVTSASLQDPNSGNTAVVNASGVRITTAQGTFEGAFINGTPSATIQGDPKAAGWSDYTFNIFGSDVKHGNLDYGTATYKWSSNQSDVISALNKMGPFSYPFENLVGNPKHPGDINFRFSTGGYPTLSNYGPSPHLLVPGDPTRTVPVGPGYVMGFHIDAQTGIVSHGACAWLDVGCQ